MAKEKTEYSVDDIINGELAKYGVKVTTSETISVNEWREMQKKIKNKSPKLYKPDEEIPFEELKEGIYHIELEGLPKWSTNNMYSGGAYYSRKQIKDRYKKIIREQFNKVVRFKNICAYEFQFKTRALDASNCSGMAKMIEDCIIPNDSYRSVGGVHYYSYKGLEDKTILHIFPITAIDEMLEFTRQMFSRFANMKIDSHNRVVINNKK